MLQWSGGHISLILNLRYIKRLTMGP